MALVGDGELAVTEGVPQLDGAVARAGDDLAVVGGEGDGQDVVGVADEAAGGGAGGELPEAESLVPRGGQGVGAVRGDDLLRPFQSAHFLPCSSGHRGRWMCDVRSPRRCGSGPSAIAWGIRTGSHRE